MMLSTLISLASSLFVLPHALAYSLVDSYDASNWYDSFNFHDEADPTNGFVDYISASDAQSSGLAKIVDNKVYLGVDNMTVLSTGGSGRKSIWITSKKPFLHGLLIGDFAHMPGSICGIWPAFWTIREDDGPYGEIDIVEGFNNIETNYATLHTLDTPAGTCVFNPPANAQTGTSNEGNTDCSSDIGCSVQGQSGSYGTSFNQNGGGVYALEWTSTKINIFFFPRNSIPEDITSGQPDPTQWGLPQANFDTVYGSCDIDTNFPRQTIYFDTTFCGANAGGQAWTDWTTCSADTGTSSCEAYVAGNPGAYDEAYWLINSVKVYQ
ncbi:glycoside hydrolase family 16 protein [Bisporella sp. PMI_857]|nr:glycoside hydrolase family 16 protein [Bisporella sp. PMI_857]